MLGLVLVALLLSAVSLYYYLIVLKHVFVHAPRTNAPVRVMWHWATLLVVLALVVIVLGMFPERLTDALRAALLTGPSFKP
jgi:NADH-quinone oxidoreductase subunit N